MITHYFPSISYTYAVDAKEFTGNRFSFGPSRSGDRNEVDAIIEALPPQTEINVRYKPSTPEVSVLIPGLKSLRLAIAGFTACLGLGGLGYSAFELRR